MSLITIFIVLLLVSFAIVAFLLEPTKTDKRIHERLASLEDRFEGDPEVEEDIVKHTTFSSIPWIDEYVRHNGMAIRLHLLFGQADVDWTVGRFVFASLFAAAIGMLAGSYYISSGMAGWIPGIALASAPYIYIAKKRSSRFRQFNELLPEAIELMSRSLRAGQSLQATIEIIGVEIRAPLGTEFRRAADEQSFGLPFREAMLNLSRRIPIPDLRFLVTAILVQKETGGNLAEVLDKTAEVLRSRIRLQGQIRAHTAQGRLTGWILCAMPFGIFLGMSILNRGYAGVLFEDPLGQRMVTIALGMMLVGMALIRKIVNIKV